MQTKYPPTFLLKEGCAAPKGCATIDDGLAEMDGLSHRKNKQTGWVGAVFFLFVVSIELFHIVYPRRIFAESPYRSRTFALKCAFVK